MFQLESLGYFFDKSLNVWRREDYTNIGYNDGDEAEERLAGIMNGIHDRCAEVADEYGSPGNYVLGANIAGFIRVAEAMRAFGVV